MKKAGYVFIIVMMLLIASSLFFVPDSHKEKGGISAGLVVREGMKVLSQNPVAVEDGKASFRVKIDDGYDFKQVDNCYYEDGVLTFTGISRSQNIYYQPAKKVFVTIDEVAHGQALLVNTGTIHKGDRVVIKLLPAEHYLISGLYVEGEEKAIPADGEYSFVAEEDAEIRVEFTGEPVNFMAITNGIGKINIINSNDEYHYGDVVKLSSEYDDTHISFLGWSADDYLTDGGVLLSTDKDLEYDLVKDSIVYANFKERSTFTLAIDANGGELKKNLDFVDQSPSVELHLPLDKGWLTRSQYTLIGYNTKPDYSGEHYSLGAAIKMPRNDSKLYGEWVKNTPEDMFVFSNGVILGFRAGADISATETLCIPQSIGGVKVQKIGPKAFAGIKSVKTVIVPVGVTSIDAEAFAGCKALSTIYLPDTLRNMASDAYKDCDGLTQLRVLASLDSVYDLDYDAALADKYSLLKNTSGKRIIVVAGSSASFGLNSPMLMERFPDYTVINFSCSSLYGMIPLMDILEDNIHEGDIVIFAPEYYAVAFATVQSDTMHNWLYIESNYDILKDINISKNNAILGKFTAFIGEKYKYLPGKYRRSGNSIYQRAGFNQYGDLVTPRRAKGGNELVFPTADLITEAGMARMNECFRNLTAQGAKCLFTFPPMENGGMSAETIAGRAKPFMTALSGKIDSNVCTIISRVEDYCFDRSYFTDLCFHTTLEGAALRTEQLIKDLENWGGVK